jgi:hypothetical protein
MANNDGGPRVWNRKDVRTVLDFLEFGFEHQRKDVMRLMEFVESFDRDAGPARDEHGRFAKRPSLEAVS